MYTGILYIIAFYRYFFTYWYTKTIYYMRSLDQICYMTLSLTYIHLFLPYFMLETKITIYRLRKMHLHVSIMMIFINVNVTNNNVQNHLKMRNSCSTWKTGASSCIALALSSKINTLQAKQHNTINMPIDFRFVTDIFSCTGIQTIYRFLNFPSLELFFASCSCFLLPVGKYGMFPVWFFELVSTMVVTNAKKHVTISNTWYLVPDVPDPSVMHILQG